MSFHNTVKLTLSIAGAELAGIVGSLFTMPAITGWYAELVRPTLAPPNWVFGPVWTTLFALMGIAVYLVWKEDTSLPSVRRALGLFVLQLGCNVLWSVLFFGMQNIELAFAEIILLWGMIVATIIAFRVVSRRAALLLVPYILWVTFAAYLNYAFMTLN